MDTAAIIIDSYLDTRNDLISYKTFPERWIEKKSIENVNYIGNASEFEETFKNHKKKDDNSQNDIAIIIKKREDYQEVRNVLISFKTKKEIIQNALAIACNKLKCQTAAIFLFSSKDGLLKRVGIQGIDFQGVAIDDSWFDEENYELGESFTGKAAYPEENSKYGRTQVSHNFESETLKNKKMYLEKLGNLNCAIAVPLNGRNKTYGVLRVVNKLGNNLNSDSRFSDNDLALVSFLGGAIAASISNYHSDSQKEILRYLQESSNKSNYNNFSYTNFYDKILSFLTGSETAYKASVLRVNNPETSVLEVKAFKVSDGVTNKKNNDPRRLDQGFVGYVVSKSRTPQIIKKISGMEEKFMNAEWIKENELKSFGCFPLIHPESEELVGTLSLFTGYEYEFHPSSIIFLNDVTSSIAVLVRKEMKKKEIEKKFKTLVEQCRKETCHFSSISDVVMHPAYQQIIGMGEYAIPLLLQELDKPFGRWFWALKSITGEDPIPEDKRGKTKAMIDAWKNWGRENNYIPTPKY